MKATLQDPEFVEKARGAQNAEEMAEVFNAYGIEITADELKKSIPDDEMELDAEEMAAVAGGLSLKDFVGGIGNVFGIIKNALDLSPEGPYGKQVQGIFNKCYNFLTGR